MVNITISELKSLVKSLDRAVIESKTKIESSTSNSVIINDNIGAIHANFCNADERVTVPDFSNDINSINHLKIKL